MSGGDQQIIALFELNNCSVEQIAEVTGYTTPAIKACLMSYSTVYRKQNKARVPAELSVAGRNAPPEDITDEDFDQLRQAALGIALRGDPESATTSRMIRFLWNEKKGRNNTKAGSITNIKTNIVMINEGIHKAREAVERALGQGSQQEVIEMETSND